MDVTKARKILGDKAKDMSDKQVESRINQMDQLSNFMIDFIEDQIKQKRLPGESANDCLKRINKELEFRKTTLKTFS